MISQRVLSCRAGSGARVSLPSQTSALTTPAADSPQDSGGGFVRVDVACQQTDSEQGWHPRSSRRRIDCTFAYPHNPGGQHVSHEGHEPRALKAGNRLIDICVLNPDGGGGRRDCPVQCHLHPLRFQGVQGHAPCSPWMRRRGNADTACARHGRTVQPERKPRNGLLATEQAQRPCKAIHRRKAPTRPASVARGPQSALQTRRGGVM